MRPTRRQPLEEGWVPREDRDVMSRARRGFRAQKLIPILNRTRLLLSLVTDSVPLSAYGPLHTPYTFPLLGAGTCCSLCLIPSLLPLFWFNTYSSCRTQPRGRSCRKPDLIPIPSHILLPAKAELGAPSKPHHALHTSLTLNLFSCIMLVTSCVHLPPYSELLVSEFYTSTFTYLCLFGT